MSDYKCVASQGGVCRNICAIGVKCDGYSEKCRLRPQYKSIETAFKEMADSISKSFGIAGDKDD